MALYRISVIVLCLALLATHALAGIRLGGVSVGIGYSHFSGPGYYAYGYPYYFYDPFWAPFPWYAPAYYSATAARPMGEVRLSGVDKLAEVYIDGGYAGVVKDLKQLRLDPGAYTVEIHAQGKAPQQRRLYVISNKTVKVDFSKEQR